MLWIATLTFAALVTMNPIAHAGPTDRTVRDVPQVAGADIATVGSCVRQTRKANDDSRFDAYVRPSGRMRVTGTEDEVQRFNACLRDQPTTEGPSSPSVSPMPRPHSRPRDTSAREPATKTSLSRRP
jgi:hypothetical protein